MTLSDSHIHIPLVSWLSSHIFPPWHIYISTQNQISLNHPVSKRPIIPLVLWLFPWLQYLSAPTSKRPQMRLFGLITFFVPRYRVWRISQIRSRRKIYVAILWGEARLLHNRDHIHREMSYSYQGPEPHMLVSSLQHVLLQHHHFSTKVQQVSMKLLHLAGEACRLHVKMLEARNQLTIH